MLLYRTEKKPFLAAAAHFVTHGPHLRTISVSLISSLEVDCSLSISFIPKLLFNVVKAGFNVVEGVHTFIFGGPSKAAEDLQTYKNDMSALRADAKSQRG